MSFGGYVRACERTFIRKKGRESINDAGSLIDLQFEWLQCNAMNRTVYE